jgi:hypothetical protein
VNQLPTPRAHQLDSEHRDKDGTVISSDLEG